MRQSVTPKAAAALAAGLSLVLIASSCSSDTEASSATSAAPTAAASTETTAASTETTAHSGMDGMDMGDAPVIPAGMAYADGQEIRFIHTEVSDQEIATLLSDMMTSPVLLVPSLAEVPESATAPVYVFTNGSKGMGPLGFQPDVFPYPPEDPQYTPLRSIHLVSWVDEAKATELKSAEEVEAAETNGDVTIEQPGVVVNMPFVTWPGGER